MDALQARVEAFVADGLTDMDTDIALFAARTYARRNPTFHGSSFDLFKSKKYAELAALLEEEEKNLERLLPDVEKPLADK